MRNYGKLAGTIVVAWFIAAVAAAANHVFANTLGRIGISVAIAAGAPILLFALWYAADSGFREFTHSLNPGTLTLLHSWRVLGLTFVVLEMYNFLPAIFALPAGLGDIAVGLTALFVGLKLANPAGRNAFILWQCLGMVDLLTAVGLGTTAPLINPAGIPMTPVTLLPLSLIPTFFVPLLFIFHVICIAQARKWKVQVSDGRTELRTAFAKY